MPFWRFCKNCTCICLCYFIMQDINQWNAAIRGIYQRIASCILFGDLVRIAATCLYILMLQLILSSGSTCIHVRTLIEGKNNIKADNVVNHYLYTYRYATLISGNNHSLLKRCSITVPQKQITNEYFSLIIINHKMHLLLALYLLSYSRDHKGLDFPPKTIDQKPRLTIPSQCLDGNGCAQSSPDMLSKCF